MLVYMHRRECRVRANQGDDAIYYSDVVAKLFGPSVDGCTVSLTLFANLFNTRNKHSTLSSYAHTPISQ